MLHETYCMPVCLLKDTNVTWCQEWSLAVRVEFDGQRESIAEDGEAVAAAHSYIYIHNYNLFAPPSSMSFDGKQRFNIYLDESGAGGDNNKKKACDLKQLPHKWRWAETRCLNREVWGVLCTEHKRHIWEIQVLYVWLETRYKFWSVLCRAAYTGKVTEVLENAQREWLLCDRDLNLDKAVQMCKATETTQGTGQGGVERRHGYAHFKGGGPAGK